MSVFDSAGMMDEAGLTDSAEFWLFGYGSLIWKPPPHYGRTCEFLAMLKATFVVSGSEDHRGTPEAPGRVVTLIKRSAWETLGDNYSKPEERVWGAAYRIKAEKAVEVQKYLDIREVNGYSVQYTPFHPSTGDMKPFLCMVYIGLPSNPQFVGVQEPQALAEHIVRSRGPSGENSEYLLMLEAALENLDDASGDRHVSDLATRVRTISKQYRQDSNK